ncbi:MAG: bifunctional 4-hydroxy-2-oxoglutarate aldolase/2-dehydro-3-deoxy-phosphogluconate aldolase [Oscillibacter sp.]|jgi:2-dehydro-3-deoxyphosphogluconate aldolase/(4S)-4-hydroxy-2-oxoglutarate aldolase|nr:bifunctional 4-hydroxy-2-oxoglutarate aldolase/2-dehydro-3-deoxy-phosphogluconate aldolase [Oscillibacter sp.]MCI9002489.1 bifunctional 4-hydroxy-2-oxoglutarate aldolase/2-dehydro-3-deoxy-phosphogluconate aldolase [Oscillibacter sp.]
MTQQEITQRVLEEKVIAIVRGIETEKCLKVAEALYAGGIRLMEVPFNPKDPASDQTTADCIAALAKEYEGRMLVGAGTVLNTKQVELTAQAGGSYIIAPNVDVNVIRRTVELGMVSMPGAMTPTEIVVAHDAGAEFVKLFPAANLGTDYVKAIRAPLSHIKLLAVGGVSEKNFADFLKVGMVGAGVGGNLANKTWIENGEYGKITEVARQLVDIAKNA